ncbi:MAG: hypothetical protein VYB44_07355 [Bacteroidota bacterium]|nr:hypothetical protein [Bacteroidota bacterium]
MTTKEIESFLFKHFSQNDYRISNSYIFNWESDFFCISRSGYSIEVEIKVSVSDFKADFKKDLKHQILAKPNKIHVEPGHESNFGWTFEGLFGDKKSYILKAPSQSVSFIKGLDNCPNRFYYCMPQEIAEKVQIPSYAGLIVPDNPRNYILKNAPLLHKQKNDLTKVLLDKFYYAYHNYRLKYSM